MSVPAEEHETGADWGEEADIPPPLTEEQRRAIIKRARRELPALQRQVEDYIRELGRIAAGR